MAAETKTPELDLLGDPIPEPHPKSRGRHKPTRPKGYFASAGTGPKGETCGSCFHAIRCTSRSGSKRWLKCERASNKWTHGRGSDILARTPACEGWAAPKLRGETT